MIESIKEFNPQTQLTYKEEKEKVMIINPNIEATLLIVTNIYPTKPLITKTFLCVLFIVLLFPVILVTLKGVIGILVNINAS